MLTVTKVTGIGDEILKAIQLNSKRKAQTFNRKQAEKYLRSCQKSGDAILIEYAQRKLNELT